MTEDSTRSKLIKGSLLVLIGDLGGMGAIFVARISAARYLGPADYGVIIVGLTLIELATIVLLFGLPQGLAQRIPRREDTEDLFTNALLITIPIGGVVTVIGVVFINDIAGLLNLSGDTDILRLFLLVLPLFLVTRVALGVIRGREDVRGRVFVRNGALQVLVLAGIGIVVYLGLGVYHVAIVWAGAFGLSAILTGLYLLWNGGDLVGTPDQTKAKELVAFSAPLMVSNTLWIVLQKADNLLLAYFSVSSSVGIYDSAYTLGRVLLMLTTGLGFLFLPIISDLDSQGRSEEMLDLYKFGSKWLAFAGLVPFVLFMTYPSELLALIYGDAFSAGYLALMALSVGFFSHCVTGNNGNSLTAIGLTRVVAGASLMTVIINLVLNLLLIPRYGITGAAVASATAFIAVNIVYSIVLYREANLHPVSQELTQTMAAGAVVIVAINLIGYDPQSTVHLVGVCLTETLLIGGLIAVFGMDSGDWDMVYDAVPISDN